MLPGFIRCFKPAIARQHNELGGIEAQVITACEAQMTRFRVQVAPAAIAGAVAKGTEPEGRAAGRGDQAAAIMDRKSCMWREGTPTGRRW